MPEIKDSGAEDNIPDSKSLPEKAVPNESGPPVTQPTLPKDGSGGAAVPKKADVPERAAKKVAAAQKKAASKQAAKPKKKTVGHVDTASGSETAAADEQKKRGEVKLATTQSVRHSQRKVRRRWPAVLAGVATLALAVGVVGAGTLYPGADATTETTPVPHPLPVGETSANCQGPTQLLAGSAVGADPEFSASPSSTNTLLDAVVLSGSTGDLPGAEVQSLDGKSTPLFTVAQAPASAAPSPSAMTGKPKARAEVVRGKSMQASSVLRLQPLGEEASRGSGSVVVDAADGDLAGLAAASCQTPSNELWLSGASTTVGRTAILVISNSSQSPATVSLEFFSGNGPLQAPAGKGLVIDAGTVRSVVLSGLAPDQELLSVHLKSAGGAVSAVIQQSILRGLTPGGIDYLAPVQAPSSALVIPGVRVQDPGAATKISAQAGYEDATTALTVTVPGLRDSVVEVKAYGPEGQVALPNGGVFTAVAGKVNQLSLAGLAKGTYSLSVRADEAVAATVRLVNSTKEGDAVDMAFVPSAARLGDTHLVSLPQNATSSLVFSAPDDGATVNLVPISEKGVLGVSKEVKLKAGNTVTVDPSALLGSGTAAVLVSASGAPSYGTQLLGTADSANIAVLPIVGTSAGAQAINLTLGY
ncbi:DUF5719 family protein [Arthrobacter antibioticus]|uniref:DUF5719 family protein n=1 Tax=Arthrobacter sp. H35-MC1 TaxID=3046203 RepID=UPI0024BB869F|nr:DUF5719 family protein [Arthrobacter sp. H35-MC1]MDJ0317192.1 DUF5719 family protein [Arthrobacter sp. H35-MC1]